jgi:hypothetical protein
MILLLVKYRSIIGRLTALIVWTREGRRYASGGTGTAIPIPPTSIIPKLLRTRKLHAQATLAGAANGGRIPLRIG